jgi:hypothetical protein
MANVPGISHASVVLPPGRQGVGILNVDLFNTVKGLKAQGYIPNRNPKSPTAVRFSIPKYAPAKAKAGTVDIWVEGKKVSVKVGKANLNAENVAGYVAGELAKEIRKLSDDYLVEFKPTKLGLTPGAASSAEITIWKKGTTAPSPAYAAYEKFLACSKDPSCTPPAGSNRPPAEISPLDPFMDITPKNSNDGILGLRTIGRDTYFTQVGFGGAVYYKLTP